VAVSVGGTTGGVIAVSAGAIVGTGVIAVVGDGASVGVGVGVTMGVSVREQALKVATMPATSRKTGRRRKVGLDIAENPSPTLPDYYTTVTKV
jgi:hypothetical protein